MSRASERVKPGKRHGKHTLRACSRCQRRIKCDGVLPSCGSCVLKGEECKPSAQPDRRTAAGRNDSRLAAQLVELSAENAALKRENALLRAQLAGASLVLQSPNQQPADAEGLSAADRGIGPPVSAPVQPASSSSAYVHCYDVYDGSFPGDNDGGYALYPPLEAPSLGPLVLGPEFDCIGDLAGEPTLFPFGPPSPLNT